MRLILAGPCPIKVSVRWVERLLVEIAGVVTRIACGVGDEIGEFFGQSPMKREAETLIAGIGALFECELGRNCQGGIAHSRKVESRDVHILQCDRGVFVQRAFYPSSEFTRVG